MKLDDDDFGIFGLDRRFAIDLAALEKRRLTLQAEVHPDRFAAQGTSAQRVAAQWSVRVNEAYGRLRNPVRRAAYLCELAGVDLAVERNTAMPPAFLMQQMEWRESLAEARDAEAVEALADAVRGEREAVLARVGAALDEQSDPQKAAALVRTVMFMDRFLEDVDRRLESFD